MSTIYFILIFLGIASFNSAKAGVFLAPPLYSDSADIKAQEYLKQAKENPINVVQLKLLGRLVTELEGFEFHNVFRSTLTEKVNEWEQKPMLIKRTTDFTYLQIFDPVKFDNKELDSPQGAPYWMITTKGKTSWTCTQQSSCHLDSVELISVEFEKSFFKNKGSLSSAGGGAQ